VSTAAPTVIASRRRTTLLWQRFVLTLLLRMSRPVQALSQHAAFRFGTRLGRLGYRLAARQRKRAVLNLHLAYGDAMSAAERERLTRRVFEHFGRGVVEFLRGPLLTKTELEQRVTCDGWQHFEEARRDGGSVVLITAHLGNWEILGRWLTNVKGLPLTVVAREPENPALGQYMRQMREGAGFAALSKGESARNLLRVLKNGEVICILPDQNSGDVFVPFFGVPAGTAAGPAALALHADAPLIPIYCLQQPDGTFRVLCLPPLSTPRTGDRKIDTRNLMAEANRVLEGVIRQYPDQWLWLHNRWKSVFGDSFRDAAWADGTDTPEYRTAYARWRGRE
jgi:Kdo2-lipid IVA lauroyltransferase/acyltransferase